MLNYMKITFLTIVNILFVKILDETTRFSIISNGKGKSF